MKKYLIDSALSLRALPTKYAIPAIAAFFLVLVSGTNGEVFRLVNSVLLQSSAPQDQVMLALTSLTVSSAPPQSDAAETNPVRSSSAQISPSTQAAAGVASAEVPNAKPSNKVARVRESRRRMVEPRASNLSKLGIESGARRFPRAEGTTNVAMNRGDAAKEAIAVAVLQSIVRVRQVPARSSARMYEAREVANSWRSLVPYIPGSGPRAQLRQGNSADGNSR
jgi:hypothetical protein